MSRNSEKDWVSQILRDFLNLYKVKYDRRVEKPYFSLIKKYLGKDWCLKLNLRIDFWLPSNGSQSVAAWTPTMYVNAHFKLFILQYLSCLLGNAV